MIWLHSLRKMMSALMSSANPNPKSDPAARSLKTSNPCSVATRGLSKLLMNGGNAHAITNKPKKRLALRLRAALSCPGVRSESFGTPPAYRPYRPITSVTRDIRGLGLIKNRNPFNADLGHYPNVLPGEKRGMLGDTGGS